MALVQGNYEIQAFPAHRADQSFTISVRRRCPHGSAQNLQFKVVFSCWSNCREKIESRSWIRN